MSQRFAIEIAYPLGLMDRLHHATLPRNRTDLHRSEFSIVSVWSDRHPVARAELEPFATSRSYGARGSDRDQDQIWKRRSMKLPLRTVHPHSPPYLHQTDVWSIRRLPRRRPDALGLAETLTVSAEVSLFVPLDGEPVRDRGVSRSEAHPSLRRASESGA